MKETNVPFGMETMGLAYVISTHTPSDEVFERLDRLLFDSNVDLAFGVLHYCIMLG